VLLAGNAVQDLAISVALDEAGRSAQPLDVVIGYDAAAEVGVVACGDQTVGFKVNRTATDVEVLVAAGSNAAWTQDSLEVLLLDKEDGDDSSIPQSEADKNKRAELLKAASAKLHAMLSDAANSSVGGPGAGPQKPAVASTGMVLEISTPPSIRHGAATVRAIIGAQQTKK
jgi:hypothetical protein